MNNTHTGYKANLMVMVYSTNEEGIDVLEAWLSFFGTSQEMQGLQLCLEGEKACEDAFEESVHAGISTMLGAYDNSRLGFKLSTYDELQGEDTHV